MSKLALVKDIKNLSLFEGLSDEELSEIASFIRIREFVKDDIIYYEKEVKKELYYLKQGEVKVYKVDRFDNEIFLYNLKDDSLITKISSLNQDIVCFGNIECIVDCEVLIINFDFFSQFCLRHPKTLLKLTEIFASKAASLECLINRELVYDGVAKVAYTLVNDFEMFNKLKKQEMAYRLNIQPETLSRILNKLNKRGLIKATRSSIDILDEDGLKEIFEG